MQVPRRRSGWHMVLDSPGGQSRGCLCRGSDGPSWQRDLEVPQVGAGTPMLGQMCANASDPGPSSAALHMDLCGRCPPPRVLGDSLGWFPAQQHLAVSHPSLCSSLALVPRLKGS